MGFINNGDEIAVDADSHAAFTKGRFNQCHGMRHAGVVFFEEGETLLEGFQFGLEGVDSLSLDVAGSLLLTISYSQGTTDEDEEGDDEVADDDGVSEVLHGWYSLSE